MPWLKDDERTEPATPKRRQEAREKGQVAKSRELPSAFLILGGVLILYFYGQYMQNFLSQTTREFLGHAGELSLTDTNLNYLGHYLLKLMAYNLLPVFVVLMLIGVLTNYVQTGWLFTTKPLEPDFSKLNPIAGLQRLVSLSVFVELFKSLFKLIIIGIVTYKTIKAELPHLSMLTAMPYHQVFTYTVKIAFKICLQAGLILCVLAIFDYYYQRYEYEENLKMTKQEVKEEFKEREGDPKVKARIRSMQREIVRRRMMEAVPKADVVITNPTHLAVALQYEYGQMAAPKVVAKGAGFLAEKIKEIARAHGVMVVENRWLAQAIYKTVEVGELIPPALYQAVAEILAYVYRLKGRSVTA